MISKQELLKGKKFEDLTQEQQSNFVTLLERINKVREAFGKPVTVTSCIRTRDEQIAIYAKKGITDISKIPFGSAHIKAAAVDIADSSGELREFVLSNLSLMEEIGMWMEDLDVTSPVGGSGRWIHFQIYAPKSGSRIFKP